ncbi:MAG TPA: HEAT repeat domain-containing protein [Pyrinomonadaceae bacterium]|nr:HEAT repeat domain-containing protein [Pyrinomonadaceae bacterium]
MFSKTLHLICTAMLWWQISGAAIAQSSASPVSAFQTSRAALIKIVRAEDERRWDDALKQLLADPDPAVRKRAALAAGRIGNEGAVPVLTEMLLTDRDNEVRQMAAFALGEMESAGGAYALVEVLKRNGQENASVRARALEALGKIVAAMISAPAATDPATKAIDEDRLDILRATIVEALRFEDSRRSRPDRLTILLALTAVLRTKPDGVGKLVAEFLHYSDSSIVATALNTLARLHLKNGNDQALELLAKHEDPIVRANAARVLGVTEDKAAFDVLLDRALHDSDERVVVSAIRALGTLKDTRAAAPLVERGEYLLKLANVSRRFSIEPRNEMLEVATTLGRLLPNTSTGRSVDLLRKMHDVTKGEAVEVEVAFARMIPGIYQQQSYKSEVQRSNTTWRQLARRAQGLAAIREVVVGAATGSAGDNALKAAQAELRDLLQRSATKPLAVSDILQAYIPTLETQPARTLLVKYLKHSDVIVRATAAELLGKQTPGAENTRALAEALPPAVHDVDNDAALAILDALAKQKNKEANDAITRALDSKDHLIRRRAVALLKANGVGDFSDRIGTVQTRNTDADYRRAIARIGKKPTATVVTTKGSFTIEFLPDDAPLNVDNFIQLAKKGYFNGQTIPRVVPNFVVQAGDPRGDQNGGPGYTIRCEINEVMFERAAVGMALSGKDTGGSQWFVTHSPQPHLDGGYTVFGRVVRGMEVVDQITRGDRIVRVVVNEK